MYSYLLKGDLSLSITMTTISTIAALGMYGHLFFSLSVNVNFDIFHLTFTSRISIAKFLQVLDFMGGSSQVIKFVTIIFFFSQTLLNLQYIYDNQVLVENYV